MNNIKRSFVILFILCSLKSISVAQSDYAINFDSLVQKSDAVVLEDLTEIEIPDNYSAEYTVSKKILIKNHKADKFCRLELRESHFREIKDIEASLTDIRGELIKELDSDEIKEADYSSDAFYSGDHYMYFELGHHTYPFIFNYHYKIKISTLLLWPNWYPRKSIPVISSSYRLTIDSIVKFRYYSKDIEIQPDIKSDDSYNIYTWKLVNIPSNLEEDYLPPEDEIQTALYFVARDFETDSYIGHTNSWDEYSNWYRSMTVDKYKLPDEAKKEILDLVKNVSETKEKIKILYDHLQKKNRYVAIEMGLAGWQPQSAEQVYLNRYGDCKDLSTYMVAILAAADIKSYPAHALTRDNGIVNIEQPSNQFNHCIVVVPLDKDSLWLECTSTYNDADDMPYTIEDINALVIGDEKGELYRTPQKKSLQNKWVSVIKGSIIGKGDLKIETIIKTSGNQKNYLKNYLSKYNSKDDNLFITDILSKNYSNLTISNLNIGELSNEKYSDFIISLSGAYNKFVPQRNDRIFINPSIFNRETSKDLPKEEIFKRKYPIYFKYPFQDIDSVFITLPNDYNMESKPQNQSIEKSFARYSNEFDLKDGNIFYVRKFELLKNYIPLNDYAEFKDFMKQVIEFDKAKIVLKKI